MSPEVLELECKCGRLYHCLKNSDAEKDGLCSCCKSEETKICR